MTTCTALTNADATTVETHAETVKFEVVNDLPQALYSIGKPLPEKKLSLSCLGVSPVTKSGTRQVLALRSFVTALS